MAKKKSQKAEKTAADSGVFRIAVDKDMIRAHANQLEARFMKEMALVGECPVVLDLSAIREIDSRGIVLCIRLFKECQSQGLKFSIVASPELFRYFRMLKLTKVIEIQQSPE